MWTSLLKGRVEKALATIESEEIALGCGLTPSGCS
jgi:hypothetical protein